MGAESYAVSFGGKPGPVGPTGATGAPGATGATGPVAAFATVIDAGDGVKSSSAIPANYVAGSGRLVIGGANYSPSLWTVAGTSVYFWADAGYTVPFVVGVGIEIVFYMNHT